MSSESTAIVPWILRHGTLEAPPARISLRAGPLRMVFEDGDLRYVRLGGREVIRRIYAMVRDGSWNTYPGKILRIDSQVLEESFVISYEAEHAGDIEKGGKVRFKNRVSISGDKDGSLRFTMQGTSHQRFLSNRIGICVLHPTPESNGTPITVEHVDGTIEHGTFPTEISATLPFTDIRAITTHAAAGPGIEVRFSGAVFEMEDQRNYGDASFKTFSTPLRMPKPVDVVVGAKVEQAVTLRLLAPAGPAPTSPARTTVTVGGPTTTTVARLGYGLHDLAGVGHDLAPIRALAPSHLHVELLLAKGAWQPLLIAASDLAHTLGCTLEVGLVAREQQFADHLIHEVADLARTREMPVSSWLVYTPKGFPSATMIARARRILTGACPAARIGGASWAGYCLLNENRPDFSSLDVVAFENNPQGHAADSSTVMENIWAMGEAVASARALAGSTPVAVAPLRMMPREGEAANNPRRHTDPRQAALFGAAWACGALSRILAEGPASVSCFELFGASGLLRAGATGTLSATAAYHVCADIAQFHDGVMVSCAVDDHLDVAALTLGRGRERRTLVSNLQPVPLEVSISGLGSAIAMRTLDESSIAEASANPAAWRLAFQTIASPTSASLAVTLPAYATSCFDSSIA